jgi:hypothetical protein
VTGRRRGGGKRRGVRRYRGGTTSLPLALGCAASILAVVCVLGSLAPGAWAAPESPASRLPASPSVIPTSRVADFASRAGYAPAYPVDTHGGTAASGEVPVAVTFARPLSVEAYATAVAYFRDRGLEVTMTDPLHLLVGLEGAAATVGAAFSTELRAGSYRGAPVLFPTQPPTLPAALESEVAGVVGLSSGFTTFTLDLRPVGTPPGAVTPDDPNTMTPALARELYGLSSLYNLSGGFRGTTYPQNASLAVLLWGEGYAPSDLETFFSSDQYYWSGFPAPKVVPYPISPAPLPSNSSVDSPDAGAVNELTLDIEWAASMAPGATIDAVYAPDGPPPGYSPLTTYLTEALDKAISLNVSAISMSFGSNDSDDASLGSSWAPLFQEAENRGITLLAASGDSGGDTVGYPCSGYTYPEFPASSPAVLAVGGTAVTPPRPPLQSSFSETAWNQSGGGFSTQYGAPSWQEVGTAAAPIEANGHRGMPDVSATAADNLEYFNGSAKPEAGTSFATPLWAGLVASIDAKWGQSLGFFTPSLYHVGAEEPSGQIGVGLVLITSGGNCVGSAGPGWSDVTGWGTPRADVLYDDLLGSFVNIALNVDRTTVAPGGSVRVTAQITNRTSHLPIANVPVGLSVAADTDLGPCTGTFGSASPTTNATGWVSATFSVPFCYLGQHALVNASVTTTKLYGTGGLRVDVNLLGFDPALEVLEQAPWAYVTYAVIVGAAAVVGVWLGRPREPPAHPVRPGAPPAAGPPAGPTVPPANPAPSPGGGAPPTPPGALRPPPPSSPDPGSPGGPPRPPPPTLPSSPSGGEAPEAGRVP